MATSTLNISLNKRNKVVYDFDEQDFLGLFFKIKVETTDEIASAKLSFVNRNDENIDIPDRIICKDFIEKKRKTKPPLSGCNFFLLNHPNKYVFFYNPENSKLTKENKIYIINCKIKKSY